MQIIADLHLHSKYARATSINSDLSGLSHGAKIKGVQVLATGDFTHPSWFEELKLAFANSGNNKENKDNKDNEGGLYEFNGIKFILSVEVSNIFELNKKIKKMHHILLAPNFDIAAQINDELAKYGNLKEDGRPTLKLSPAEFLEIMDKISRDIFIIPAHIWTPWFSIFGSKSGVDNLEEAYGEMKKNIFALETGLSSDPKMNWMLSALDKYTLVSNSDSHSPEKIGREANVFELEEISYNSILNAIKTKKGFVKTYEFFPEEGKYHYDGHRNCNVLLDPWKAKKIKNICPICRKGLTIGVMHRIADLADRELGFKPENAIPFKHIVPLQTVIAKALGKSEIAIQVKEEYDKLITYFGNEFAVYETNEEQLRFTTNMTIANAIINVNNERVRWIPGYDGVFGELILDSRGTNKKTNKEIEFENKQKNLNEFF
ncbi:MAG: endonuclease Q family protein [Candidatus Micrarchaeota archaeon]